MNSTTPSESDQLDTLKSELAGIQFDQTPVVSIAIWGWQGDGKTTSMLTAVHFAEPLDDLLGFAPVREHDEISEIAKRPELSDMPLLHLAKVSAAKIEKLLMRFMDEQKWPDGTDSGDAYLLRVEDTTSTRAFAVITDLPGGSYSEHDKVAESVIENAHAIVIMVAPERWLGATLNSRAYQNMVRYRIRRCTELHLPVSILVAQSDKDKDAAISVQKTLMRSVNELDTSYGCEIFIVSVIDDQSSSNIEQSESNIEKTILPPPADRNPATLLLAWVWTFVKAIANEAASPKTHIPLIQLEQVAKTPAGELTSLAELRLVGDFSGLSGTMLCPITNTGAECSFLLLQDSGTLVDVSLNADGSVPKLSNLGVLKEADSLVTGLPEDEEGEEDATEGESIAAELQSKIFDGELIVGQKSNPGSIWKGHLHDLVQPLPLPTAVVAWHALTADLVAGIDGDGRLHLFRSKTEQWAQEHYLPDFLSSSEETPFLSYLASSRVLIAGNGSSTEAVLITDNGFGDRVTPPFELSFDIDGLFLLSGEAGSVAHLDESRNLFVTSTELKTNYGEILQDSDTNVALGNTSSSLVAWIDQERKLRVAISTVDESIMSDDKLSPALPNLPMTTKWATGDKLLAVDLGNETWQLYKLLGI